MAVNGFLHGIEVKEIDGGTRSIQAVDSATIGIIGTAPDGDAEEFPLNKPVLIAGSRLKAGGLDTKGKKAGTLPAALDLIFEQIGAVVVVIRVAEETDSAATRANIVGGVVDGQYKGIQAFLSAKSITGRKPRLLIAPGFTNNTEPSQSSTNQISDNKTSKPSTTSTNTETLSILPQMVSIAEKLGAIIIADGPNATDEAAIRAVKNFGSRRIFMVDPGIKTLIGDSISSLPASAAIAGLIAKTDYQQGFWVSPSNKVINGIVGTSRPIDFSLNDRSSRANLLNEANIATIIQENGYRLWGNRTLSDDPKWAFLPVVRTADMINEALLASHLWALDRNITKTYLDEVSEGVNAYLRQLKAVGAILGGNCFPNKEFNSAAAIAGGHVQFDFDFAPAYPAERITFRSRINNDYIEELF